MDKINAAAGPIAEAAQLVERLNTPKVVPVKGSVEEGAQILLTPVGMTPHSVKKYLDEYRTKPERRQGTATFTRLEGLIDHALRFKDGNSALFAHDNPTEPELVAVLDYHPKGEDNTVARFGRHRGLYKFPLSPEFKAWRGFDGKPFTGQEFYQFLEERAMDVAPSGLLDLNNAPLTTPAAGDGTDMGTKRLLDMARLLGTNFAGPDKLLSLAKGLRIRVDSQFEEQRDINSGEFMLLADSKHKDAEGQALKVPNLFAINIPIFSMGEIYLMGVRLRYRLKSGEVTWTYQIHRLDLAFTDAFDEACEKAAKDTGLPLFYGRPE